jgi:peptidoglycan-associated lipoprotein
MQAKARDMKRTNLRNWLVVGLVTVTAASGCTGKRPVRSVTPIPNPQVVQVPADTTTKPIAQQPPSQPVTQPVTPQVTQPNLTGGNPVPPPDATKGNPVKQNDQGIEAAALPEFEGMVMDTNIFKAQTVYFDFDRFNVKPAEVSKAESVAGHLKEMPDQKLLIDGHCDERGTEEYNRALGERRSLSLRELMVRLGVAPERIRTRSWGEDVPADFGHDDAAWAKNRRGEFILLLPKK